MDWACLLQNGTRLTLLASQRMWFSVKTLQVVVTAFFVLFQRALLLVAAATIVAFVGLANRGGGD